MSYSEENERGAFVATTLNLQGLGAAIGGFIPLMMNYNKVSGSPFRQRRSTR